MAFAEPTAFLVAALFAVLVFLHLRARSTRVVVPSLLLWDALPEDDRSSRRFRPNLPFVVQLLALTLLIAALARPYVPSSPASAGPTRYVFVVDTSASMAAVDAGVPRFEAAGEIARRELAALPPGDEVMVVAAGPTPEVVLPFDTDRVAARAAIDRLHPADTSGDLAVALAFADGFRRRSSVPTGVYAFTDLPRARLPEKTRDRVTVFSVGKSDDNAGIENLQVYQGRFEDPRAARVQVEVRNFSERDRHGVLAVELEGRAVERREFDIPARGARGFTIGGFTASGRVTGRLEGTDALPADDRAYGWIRPSTKLRVVLVAPPSALAKDLADLGTAVGTMQLTTIAPEEAATTGVPPADVYVFYAFSPPRPVGANALYVFPPANDASFPAIATVENVEVLDWNAAHPGMRGLGGMTGLAALPLRRTRVIDPPPASEALLWSRAGRREIPLAFAGERDGQRYACLAFDLGEERLLHGENASLLLFFVSLLGWLSPDGGAVPVVRTGEPHAFDRAASAGLRLRDPRGEVLELKGADPVVVPLAAGEYRVDSAAGEPALLANFFDADESDIGRPEAEPPLRVAPEASAAEPVPAVPAEDYRPWLYAAAIAVLLAEWFLARPRTSPKSSA